MNKIGINVLIVEDSPTVQHLLRGIVAEDPAFGVVEVVDNGAKALEYVARVRPDVISMDINMPVMDGLEATKQIMAKFPVPIVIVSSHIVSADVELSFKMLKAGALAVLPKPVGPLHSDFIKTARNYRNTLKLVAGIKVSLPTRQGSPISKILVSESPADTDQLQKEKDRFKILAIGGSAGGPIGLQTILNALPSGFPVPVMIVQHIDPNFASGFCDWLNQTSSIPIKIAVDGEKLVAGHAYLPPGDKHLGVHREGVVKVGSDLPERNLRPSVDYLFRSIGNSYKGNAIAVILSGMGTDGAKELKKLRESGVFTMAQDKASSLVHGMPGEAIRIGAATVIANPEDIANELIKLLMQQ